MKPKERDIHKMIIAFALGSFSKTLGCWRHLRCDLSLYALQLPSAKYLYAVQLPSPTGSAAGTTHIQD